MQRYEVTDNTGNHRLKSIGVSGFWNRLVWERKENEKWETELVITKDEFQVGDGTKRWVSELASLDPVEGTAILQVGHGDIPERTGRVTYNYSWWLWDLRANCGLKMLKICDDPFEPFEIGS